MRLKYNEGETPLRNEHSGFVYSKIRELLNAGYARKQARTRYPPQFQRMQNLMKAVRFWRNMPPATVQAWNDFAAMFPQPSKADPDVFLTGYQLFLKRNQYCFLNHGTETEFMETPVLSIPPEEPIIFRIAGGENSIDATELYIKRFGILPKVGDFIFLHAIVMHEFSGNFYPQYDLKIEVEEVFVDGLFVQVEIPDSFRDCTVSVYLSKPAGRGQNFAGSKIRYMGCFTKKTFLQLTDTPDSYVGQAGKVVTVKEDETGLEFTESGGGGLTCEDLLDCPTILEILDSISVIEELLVPLAGVSIPAVKFGLLFNGYAAQNPLFSSGGGWQVLDLAAAQALAAYWPDYATAAQALCLNDADYWLSPSPLMNNSSGFRGIGSGRRYATYAAFGSLKQTMYIWLNTQYSSINWYVFTITNTATTISFGNYPRYGGFSVRMYRPAPGVADGTKGVYIQNNGNKIATIVINEVEYTLNHSTETELSDGTIIPEINAAATWAAATTPALCAYNNDWANV